MHQRLFRTFDNWRGERHDRSGEEGRRIRGGSESGIDFWEEKQPGEEEGKGTAAPCRTSPAQPCTPAPPDPPPGALQHLHKHMPSRQKQTMGVPGVGPPKTVSYSRMSSFRSRVCSRASWVRLLIYPAHISLASPRDEGKRTHLILHLPYLRLQRALLRAQLLFLCERLEVLAFLLLFFGGEDLLVAPRVGELGPDPLVGSIADGDPFGVLLLPTRSSGSAPDGKPGGKEERTSRLRALSASYRPPPTAPDSA
jgi:hypothetical protein